MKKIISLMLMLCLVMSLCTISAWAEEKTVTTGAELEAAVENANNGDIISLGANITLDVLSDNALVVNTPVSLKFNGYNIYTGGNIIRINQVITFVDGGHIYGAEGDFEVFAEPVTPANYFMYIGDTGLVTSVDANSTGAHVVLIPGLPENYPTDITSNPGATAPELSCALKFIADLGVVTCAQAEYYPNWLADFTISFNKSVKFCAGNNGQPGNGADGYLSGHYENFSSNWLTVPFDTVEVAANEDFEIMGYASTQWPVFRDYSYLIFIYGVVKEFDCGIFFTEEFLEANPDLEVTISLKTYEEGSYYDGQVYRTPNGEVTTGESISSKTIRVVPEPAPTPAPTPTPTPAPAVPATGDNSNVPLWGVLFLGFAAVAVMTMGKKRRS